MRKVPLVLPPLHSSLHISHLKQRCTLCCESNNFCKFCLITSSSVSFVLSLHPHSNDSFMRDSLPVYSLMTSKWLWLSAALKTQIMDEKIKVKEVKKFSLKQKLCLKIRSFFWGNIEKYAGTSVSDDISTDVWVSNIKWHFYPALPSSFSTGKLQIGRDTGVSVTTLMGQVLSNIFLLN